MTDFMMKMQLDKIALIILILDVFGSLNMQIDPGFSSKSTGIISCIFECIVKKLKCYWQKNIDAVVNPTFHNVTHLQIVFCQLLLN